MERLIRTRLTEALPNLEGRIYFGKAPPDVETTYPQIIFETEKFSDALHGVAGLLNIDILCTRKEKPAPYERAIRRALEGKFFRAKKIFLLKWSRSELFEEPASERAPLITGLTATFEVRELPCAQTASPDPIQSLQYWALPFGTVIGLSDFGEVCSPTQQQPALYFDVDRLRLKSQTHALVWLEADIKCHVFAPGVEARRHWLTLISHELFSAKGIRLTDGSPMRLLNLEYDWSAEELSGQIKATFEYGLPIKFFDTAAINHRQYDWRLLESRF